MSYPVGSHGWGLGRAVCWNKSRAAAPGLTAARSCPVSWFVWAGELISGFGPECTFCGFSGILIVCQIRLKNNNCSLLLTLASRLSPSCFRSADASFYNEACQPHSHVSKIRKTGWVFVPWSTSDFLPAFLGLPFSFVEATHYSSGISRASVASSSCQGRSDLWSLSVQVPTRESGFEIKSLSKSSTRVWDCWEAKCGKQQTASHRNPAVGTSFTSE